MALEIDLTKYCPRGVIDRGLSLYKSQGIAQPECVQTTDGAWLLKGKSVDSFNFVNHPWLVVDRAGRKLLGFGCDCRQARRERTICEHCTSLCFAWMEQVPDYIFAQEQTAVYGYGFGDGNPIPVPEHTVVVYEPVQPVRTVEPARQVQTVQAVQPAQPVQPEPERPDVADVPQAEAPAEKLRTMEILLGRDPDGTDILWQPNDTERVFHTNMGIIGTMGTGKTQLAKSVITQLYRQQTNNFDGSPLGILIFDYKGDYNETKQDFVQATGARVLKPFRLPYNPLALYPGKAFKPLLPVHTANEFKDTISQIYRLGPKQQQFLLECIMEAYKKQGIDPQNPATWGRVAPTVDQVYKIFLARAEDRSQDTLNAAMSQLGQFCLFEDDPKKAKPLEALLKGVVVIDISGYDRNIQSTIVAITLNQFYAQMHARGSSRTDGRYRQLSKFIMVDEADTFMEQKLSVLRKIMKEGREFGVGVILSSQSLRHYIGHDDDYSRYVLTWVVHNVNDLSQREVEYVFKLRPKSQAISRTYGAIKALSKHESLVKVGNDDPLVVHNMPFYRLLEQIRERK